MGALGVAGRRSSAPEPAPHPRRHRARASGCRSSSRRRRRGRRQARPGRPRSRRCAAVGADAARRRGVAIQTRKVLPPDPRRSWSVISGRADQPRVHTRELRTLWKQRGDTEQFVDVRLGGRRRRRVFDAGIRWLVADRRGLWRTSRRRKSPTRRATSTMCRWSARTAPGRIAMFSTRAGEDPQPPRAHHARVEAGRRRAAVQRARTRTRSSRRREAGGLRQLKRPARACSQPAAAVVVAPGLEPDRRLREELAGARRLVHFLQDVAAADETAVDVELGSSASWRSLDDLADLRVLQYVRPPGNP